ncbi:MAG: hypothetical protein ACO1PI_00815 [Bacteroidota bacterium]
MAKGKNKRFIRRLKNKYRLIIMNDGTLQERASIVLKPMNVFILFSMLLVVFTTLIVLLLFYTPLKEYIPGFDKTDYLRMQMEQEARIDSLERANNRCYEKWQNMEKVLEGRFERADSIKPTQQEP